MITKKNEQTNEVSLTEQQQQLANIKLNALY